MVFVFSFAAMIPSCLKRCIRLLLVALIVFVSSGYNTAQKVVSYSTTQGLAHHNVLCLYHDPGGYLWIGTWDGLSRFDGHTFESFKHAGGDTTSVGGNIIHKILPDNEGNIWVLAGHNLSKFNPRTNSFSTLIFPIINSGNISNNKDFVFDTSGMGWFIRAGDLFQFNPENFDIRFLDVSDISLFEAKLIYNNRGLWIAASGGLFNFSADVLQSQNNLLANDAGKWFQYPEYFTCFGIIQLVSLQNGGFVLQSNYSTNLNQKLFMAHEASSMLIEIPQPPFVTKKKEMVNMRVHEISPNQILISTGYPVFSAFDLEKWAYEYEHPLKEVFANLTYYSIYYDRQHNLWIGTTNGLYKYSLPQIESDSWVYDPNNSNTISGYTITSLSKDKNNKLWVGTRDGGLDKIDLNTGRIIKTELPAEMLAQTGSGGLFNIVPVNDEVLLLNYGTSFMQYNTFRKEFSFFKPVNFRVYTTFWDDDGRLWTSEKELIEIWEIDEQKTLETTLYTNDFARFQTNCRQIYQARNGQKWITCGQGIVKLNEELPGESKLFTFSNQGIEPEVICIHENPDGTFWLGTLRHGIYAFDPATETFTANYSTQNGLIDNSVNKIYEDQKGFLWMSTWKGIVRMNSADTSFANFSVVNGLPFSEFNTNAHIMDDDGTIYFGGEGGVVAFHPDSLVNFEFSTTPGITAIHAGSGLLPLKYPLGDGAGVVLPYNQNAITLNFSAFDLRQPDERMYRYRLEGWRNEWRQNNSGDLTADFAGMPPGEYLFRMQTTYRGWPWILEELQLKLVISQVPFYKQTKFQIGVLLAFVVSLIVIFMMRQRNVAMQKVVLIARVEREANQYRLNFLKSQMNPHFYFNTLNSINSYVLNNDAKSANKYLTTFARLMREILENSQREFITIAEEKEVLDKYISLQQLRYHNTFEYKITAEDRVKQHIIPPMLVQPFVENATEYAFVNMPFKGIIHVTFELINNNIVCTITDNGIGIQNSQKLQAGRARKSAAISNISQRIEMINKIFKVSIQLLITPFDNSDKDFPGTQIRLIIPIINNR